MLARVVRTAFADRGLVGLDFFVDLPFFARGAAGLKRVNDQSVSAQSAAYALMGVDCTADAARLRYNPSIHNRVDVGATN